VITRCSLGLVVYTTSDYQLEIWDSEGFQDKNIQHDLILKARVGVKIGFKDWTELPKLDAFWWNLCTLIIETKFSNKNKILDMNKLH